MWLVPQDPLEAVRQKCEEAEHCVHTRGRLEECEGRVGSRSATEEDCTEELFDFLHARDHCVSRTNAKKKVLFILTFFKDLLQHYFHCNFFTEIFGVPSG